MRLHARALLTAGASLLAVSCVSTPDGGCPRAGLDLSRRCKRLCVLTPGKNNAPLPCACVDECLCWQMPGHSRRLEPAEAGGQAPG
jgi:hypothetical protein